MDSMFMGSGCRVQGSGFRVEGLGFRIQDLGFIKPIPSRRFGLTDNNKL